MRIGDVVVATQIILAAKRLCRAAWHDNEHAERPVPFKEGLAMQRGSIRTGRGELGRALAGLVALCACTEPVKAQTNSMIGDPEAEPAVCLQVHGTLTDDAVALRLAAPPLSAHTGAGIMQMFMQRALGGGATPGLPAGVDHGSAGANMMLGAPPPATRALIDGSVDANAGRHAQAQARLGECAGAAAQAGDSLLEAACRNNLAVTLAAQGSWARARTELETAQRLYRAPRDVPAQLPQLMQPGAPVLPAEFLARLPPAQRAAAEAQMGAQQSVLAQAMQQAAAQNWRQMERIDAVRGSERTLLNLGNLALAAGRAGEAEPLLREALQSRIPGETAACSTAAAMDLARLMQRLGRSADARALVARHQLDRLDGAGRPAQARAGSRLGGRHRSRTDSDSSGSEAEAAPRLLEAGALRLAVDRSPTVAAATVAPAPTPAPQAAIPPPAQRIAAAPTAGTAARRGEVQLEFTFSERGSRFDDSALAQQHQYAARLDAAGGPPALRAWRLLALRAAAARRPDLGYAAHAALMALHMRQGEAAAAIHHGKRAANLAQAVRAALSDRTPSREARRALLRQRRQLYVALAQALLDAGRLTEAEAVLQLLKEDEGQQFIDPPTALGTLALNPAEARAAGQDEELAAQLRQSEQDGRAAVARLPIGGNVLLMAEPRQVEAMRLASALELNGLAAALERRPLQVPVGDAAWRSAADDLIDLLVGPGGRLGQLLTRLIEDGPRFDPPMSAADRTRLTDTLNRLPRLQAQWRPLLREVREESRASVTVRPPGQPSETEAWRFAAAEPLERLWRGRRQADELEARHLDAAAPASVQALAAPPPSPSEPDRTRALLARLSTPTTLLYFLPGEQRLDVLMVSAGGRRHFRSAVPEAALNAEIDAFVQLLREHESEPLAAAQALYRRLLAPLEEALAASGARVLALSLAGRLRFVPFAALHDRQAWLVERYALAIHAGGELEGRLRPASPQWRAAAFGATIGDAEFAPLAFVAREVAAVVRQRNAPGGALPGEAWLDRAFTAERVRAALDGSAQVVHIASHFKFQPGDAAGSYLLLGDGGRLSLKELASPKFRFDRTELVTLSACATGLSSDDLYGQEVDGLAALLMGQGAPSVIASLWDVDDRSTATIMASLYKLRESQKLSRVSALQQAQLAMIRAAAAAAPRAARPAPAGAAPNRAASRVRLPGDPEPEPAPATPAPSAPAKLGAAHPFFWAPFVLMGNWL